MRDIRFPRESDITIHERFGETVEEQDQRPPVGRGGLTMLGLGIRLLLVTIQF